LPVGATANSNLGMDGVREFPAIIDPPRSTILAIGAPRRHAGLRNDLPARRRCAPRSAIVVLPCIVWQKTAGTWAQTIFACLQSGDILKSFCMAATSRRGHG
jgi:hypothetical protein